MLPSIVVSLDFETQKAAQKRCAGGIVVVVKRAHDREARLVELTGYCNPQLKAEQLKATFLKNPRNLSSEKNPT